MRTSDIIFAVVIFGLCTGFVLYHYLRYRKEMGGYRKHQHERRA